MAKETELNHLCDDATERIEITDEQMKRIEEELLPFVVSQMSQPQYGDFPVLDPDYRGKKYVKLSRSILKDFENFLSVMERHIEYIDKADIRENMHLDACILTLLRELNVEIFDRIRLLVRALRSYSFDRVDFEDVSYLDEYCNAILSKYCRLSRFAEIEWKE